MPEGRDRGARRGIQLLGALMAAGLLCLALVLPALGAAVGPTKLEQPTVTPRSGSTSTLITFSVSYRSAKGSAPEYVRVVVGSATYSMSASATDWKQGVIFSVRTSLPVGTMNVRFEARDSEKFADETDGGTVTIGAAEPTPTPTPTPTASPTPSPTATPTAPPTSPPTPAPATGPAPTPIAAPEAAPEAAQTATQTAAPEAAPTASQGTGPGSTVGGSSGSGPAGSGGSGGPAGSGGSGGPEGSGTASRSGGSAAGRGGVPVGGGTGDGSSNAGTSGSSGTHGSGDAFASWLGGAFGGSMAALGLQGPGHMPTLPAMLVSSVAVTTWMAFMLFNKKRRDEEPPEPETVLRAHAAIGMGMAPNAGLAEPEDPEALMPRWRRPSLILARKTDPIRTPAPARVPMSFSIQPGGIPTDIERRQVRYAVAALLDHPDELRSTRVSEVAAGDELQVEGRSGSFCQVVCPDGRRGWIHRTALSDPLASGGRPWVSSDFEPPIEAENALAALLAARGLQRKAI